MFDRPQDVGHHIQAFPSSQDQGNRTSALKPIFWEDTPAHEHIDEMTVILFVIACHSMREHLKEFLKLTLWKILRQLALAIIKHV